MPDQMRITVGDGGEDFEAAIMKLDRRSARNALQRALSQAATPLVKEARRRAPGPGTGNLKRNIKKRSVKKAKRISKGLDQAVMVYLNSDAFYGLFYEFGFVHPDRGHVPAKPWMRPALEATEFAIIQRYQERAGKIIDRELEKRGRR